ncbi:MAG: class I SAM-dependent methyltransferase [Thermoguttaceae bacterium]
MEMEAYFFEAFEGLERLAPGSDQSSRKAMSLIPGCYHPVDSKRFDVPDAEDVASSNAKCLETGNASVQTDVRMKILDIGCGVGTHTFILAEQFPNARITAIDNHVPYITQFNKTAQNRNLSDRVCGEVLSMFEMPFADESFDLIYSEGSIYIAGFQNGLRDWKRFLKKNGCLLCSEIVWTTDQPSRECLEFWNTAYSEMDSMGNKCRQIAQVGYQLLDCFVLPQTDWTTHYYDRLQVNLDRMREKYATNETARQVLEMVQSEINLHRQFAAEYNYCFFAMQKS